ncbi:hypothetical protein AB0D66_33150 [Streptomyces sp. NPDC048270]|uniref:hypothetical protein n=1 Tax=Streptomyces sp. NPDC048270 TaxID=3154615 RepID=UPI0033C14166
MWLRNLADSQCELADRLVRAELLRAEVGRDGEALSIRDAVALAAVQLGPPAPAQG